MVQASHRTETEPRCVVAAQGAPTQLVHCTGITWDRDAEDVTPVAAPLRESLPTEAFLCVPPLREWDSEESLAEELADQLSTMTGFAVTGFSHQLVDAVPVRGVKLLGKDLAERLARATADYTAIDAMSQASGEGWDAVGYRRDWTMAEALGLLSDIHRALAAKR